MGLVRLFLRIYTQCFGCNGHGDEAIRRAGTEQIPMQCDTTKTTTHKPGVGAGLGTIAPIALAFLRWAGAAGMVLLTHLCVTLHRPHRAGTSEQCRLSGSDARELCPRLAAEQAYLCKAAVGNVCLVARSTDRTEHNAADLLGR